MDTIVESKRSTWSNDEDLVLIEMVKRYPTNLKHAFSEAAVTLGNKNRTQTETRWYNHLRKRNNVDAVSVGSERGFSKNTKNVPRKDGTMPEQGLRPHLYVLKQIFNLSPAERDEIVRILTSNL